MRHVIRNQAPGLTAASAPWSVSIGLARTLLALSAFGTLAFSSVETLLQPGVGVAPPFCSGASQLSLWCLAPTASFPYLRWAAVLILLAVASGWRPRLTAIPLWWILFSNQASLTLVDGGDQIAAILALLLLPISLTDSRKWHWSRVRDGKSRKAWVLVGARMTSRAIRLQVAFIYLNACLSKLSVAEWLDGTAVFYWLQDPLFGPAGMIRDATDVLMIQPVMVATTTWGTLFLEFFLGIAWALPPSAKGLLLILGLAFHFAIGLTMGLWSFAFTMWAALVLYLCPPSGLLRIVHKCHGSLRGLAESRVRTRGVR